MDPTSPGYDRPGDRNPEPGVHPAVEPTTPAADPAATEPLPAATPPTREPGTDMTQPTDVPPATTAAAPTAAAPTAEASTAAASTAAAPTAVTPTAEAPARPSGPNAPAILLGLACLAVAVLAILHETTSLVVNWSALGPGAVIAAGVLLLVVGVVGLARRER